MRKRPSLSDEKYQFSHCENEIEKYLDFIDDLNDWCDEVEFQGRLARAEADGYERLFRKACESLNSISYMTADDWDTKLRQDEADQTYEDN